MNTYHVAKSGSNSNPGTEAAPLLTIDAAAKKAQAGDTVIVHEGTYREWVNPRNGGLSNARCITYMAAEGERVAIKGSERIDTWENVKGDVWKVTLPNSFFGSFNPYVETVGGDWLLEPYERPAHLGDVYLNGMSFYETGSLESVYAPKVRKQIQDHWTQETVPIKNTEQTKYLWYCEVDDENTVIYANFHGADPNAELVEINVRKCCFYPHKTGINYITVRGFELAQAACPWTPPTADQPGLIGAHWSKGWIIEDNVIHDAKCSAVSIGKEHSTGHNDRSRRCDKPGYTYQLEAVFKALKIGWSKEKIGSHIIRNNTIFDCGQNGIVGHMGCVFSQITGNHIYNIAIKREFYGHEIAGIKLHAPIDVVIMGNRIHDCSLGIWLDWQAQGTRISRNLLYENNRDLFMEVSHGPSVIDYNILGSRNSLYIDAQGMAYIHNLIAGKVFLFPSTDRATPYHAPHSTDVTGFSAIYGGDDRFYQNIFIGDGKPGDGDLTTNQTKGKPGTALFNGRPTSLEEYIELVDANQPCDHTEFFKTPQPVFIKNNVYLNGAVAFERETDKLDCPDFDPCYSIETAGREPTGVVNKVYLNINLPDGFNKFISDAHSTRSLGRARIVDADFENPDGSELLLDTDYFGAPVGKPSVPGPISTLRAGENRICVG